MLSLTSRQVDDQQPGQVLYCEGWDVTARSIQKHSTYCTVLSLPRKGRLKSWWVPRGESTFMYGQGGGEKCLLYLFRGFPRVVLRQGGELKEI